MRGNVCVCDGVGGRAGKLRIGMGIIVRATEGDIRMDPGVEGIGILLPSIFGVLGATALGVTAGSAEPAAEDCPDAYPESYISGLPCATAGRSLIDAEGDCMGGRESSKVVEFGEKSREWSGRVSWKVVFDAPGSAENVSL